MTLPAHMLTLRELDDPMGTHSAIATKLNGVDKRFPNKLLSMELVLQGTIEPLGRRGALVAASVWTGLTHEATLTHYTQEVGGQIVALQLVNQLAVPHPNPITIGVISPVQSFNVAPGYVAACYWWEADDENNSADLLQKAYHQLMHTRRTERSETRGLREGQRLHLALWMPGETSDPDDEIPRGDRGLLVIDVWRTKGFLDRDSKYDPRRHPDLGAPTSTALATVAGLRLPPNGLSHLAAV